jgi:hypothetical protein
VSDPGTAYLLTSYAAVSANGSRTPTTDTDVGQPNNDDSCSLCCSDTIGEFSKGGPDNVTMPAALVKLEDDQKWVAEIMQIGLIDSLAPPLTAFDVDHGDYQVRKRGIGTRLTGGVITAVGGVRGVLPPGVRPDSVIIRPNPNAFKPGEDICFSHFTDRGALVLNKFNQVVGFLYDEAPILDHGISVVHGVAAPIRTVLNELNNLPDVNITLATANTPDRVQTTTNRVATPHETATPPLAGRSPAVAGPLPRRDPRPLFPVQAPAVAGAFARLRDDLSTSTAGRLAIAMWTEHRREIRHLIDHNRRVATVWHRSGGPALLQAFVRALNAPAAAIPRSVNGIPTATCLDRLVAVLCRFGSPGLQEDVVRFRSQLPSIGGLTLAEILSGLDVETRQAAFSD